MEISINYLACVNRWGRAGHGGDMPEGERFEVVGPDDFNSVRPQSRPDHQEWNNWKLAISIWSRQRQTEWLGTHESVNYRGSKNEFKPPRTHKFGLRATYARAGDRVGRLAVRVAPKQREVGLVARYGERVAIEVTRLETRDERDVWALRNINQGAAGRDWGARHKLGEI